MKKVKNTINVVAGKEYQLRIAEIDDNLPKDFFYPTYVQAFNEAKKIILENNENKKVIESSNNIISFCGERGQGKSSTMLSFSKILSEIDVASKYFDTNDIDIADYKFHVLHRIDPTELEINHSILNVIISRIFFDFKKEAEKDTDKNIDAHLFNNIINDFQKCYRNINTIKDEHRTKDYNYGIEDNIEALSIISDSANIKNDFHKLIQDFLEMKYKNKKAYVVIQVDDTDLNVGNAYEIVEDIRKYFMMPNVLVLMATNIELLTKAIDQEFQQSFSILLENQQISPQNTCEMANQYIVKLMPGSRRINLPEIKSSEYDNINESVQITYKNYNMKGKLEDIYCFKYRSNENITDLQEYVLRLIYEKTGLVFVKSVDTIHRIIPQNIRVLSNFLSVLRAMPDIRSEELTKNCDINDVFKNFLDENQNKKSIELIDIRINNLNKFKEYFLETFIKDNFSTNIYNFYNEMCRLVNNNKIEFTISFLHGYFFDKKNAKSKDGICYNICSLLNEEKNLNSVYSNEREIFCFATNTIYSIILNVWYCNHIKEYKIFGENFADRSIVDFLGKVYGQFFSVDEHNEENEWGHKIKISENEYNDFYIGQNKKEVTRRLVSSFGVEINKKFFMSYQNSFYIYNFDPENFLLRSLEPQRFLKSNIVDNDIETNIELDEFFYFRNLAFIVSTNIDLMETIIKNGINKNSNMNYSDYLCKAFEKIYITVDSLRYLPINNIGVSWVTEILKKEGEFINRLMNISYYTEDSVNRLKEILQLLVPLKGQKSIIEIKDNILRLLSITENIYNIYPMINIKPQISELKRILSNAQNAEKSGKEWSKKTCDTYRQEINRYITIIKSKCLYFINE